MKWKLKPMSILKSSYCPRHHLFFIAVHKAHSSVEGTHTKQIFTRIKRPRFTFESQTFQVYIKYNGREQGTKLLVKLLQAWWQSCHLDTSITRWRGPPGCLGIKWLSTKYLLIEFAFLGGSRRKYYLVLCQYHWHFELWICTECVGKNLGKQVFFLLHINMGDLQYQIPVFIYRLNCPPVTFTHPQIQGCKSAWKIRPNPN